MNTKTPLTLKSFDRRYGDEITITFDTITNDFDPQVLRQQLSIEHNQGREIWVQIKDIVSIITENPKNGIFHVHSDIIQASDYIYVIDNRDNDEKGIDQQALHNSDNIGIPTGIDSTRFNDMYNRLITRRFNNSKRGTQMIDAFRSLKKSMEEGNTHIFYYTNDHDHPYIIPSEENLSIEDIENVYRIYVMDRGFRADHYQSPSVSDKAASDVPSYYCNLAQNEDDKCSVQCDECRKHELAGAELSQEYIEESKQKVAEADTIISLSRKTVWDLKMHEDLIIKDKDNNLLVTRVPGGWLYKPYPNHVANTVFVPWVDQIHNTGCTLCGNNNKRMAHQILDVLNHLNDNQASIDSDGDLLKYIEEYLNTSA